MKHSAIDFPSLNVEWISQHYLTTIKIYKNSLPLLTAVFIFSDALVLL